MIKNTLKNVELLAPVGDISRLETAIYFGADAVYLAGKNFGLRSAAVNFTDDELKTAVKTVHSAGKKIYVTVNIFARNGDFDKLKKYVIFLERIGVDAVIVSDLGVLKIVRENTKLDIHISTQANILNKFTAEQYAELGAKRIILARECGIDEIREIAKHLGNKCEIEVFVHGAMCISYSGRCLLSDYMTASKGLRQSNRGECAQPCRWSYRLVEETRPNQFFPIEQDGNGTYIMNSRDLCLIEHLEILAAAGVASFKIEGRMKTEYYVAGVVNTYRRAMDGERFDYIKELEKTAHRPFTTGFVFGNNAGEIKEFNGSVQSYEYTAIVLPRARGDVTECEKRGIFSIELRNAFNAGDTLEILSPTENFNKQFTVEQIFDEKNQPIKRANRPKQILKIACPYSLNPNDILRKKVETIYLSRNDLNANLS